MRCQTKAWCIHLGGKRTGVVVKEVVAQMGRVGVILEVVMAASMEAVTEAATVVVVMTVERKAVVDKVTGMEVE